jgi:hypothetical protein
MRQTWQTVGKTELELRWCRHYGVLKALSHGEVIPTVLQCHATLYSFIYLFLGILDMLRVATGRDSARGLRADGERLAISKLSRLGGKVAKVRLRERGA